ncbi:hypothetical protein FAGAP_10374 [Fusarium agapanthi]|uniref:DUF6603 domain-containing protein n=1 Tax=Fusarium agapanthi TaxID=1803897 RepID=A0A9P5B159_9HYPO|nr:hypothetical protein FAGAP_10374 [Fusarium agapanthi]
MALDSVKLHMVFAGRGDSFTLEVGDGLGNRRLVLIDGGPDGHRYDTTGSPYSRYLMATIRRVWGPVGTVEVAQIINSHPDEDHYKGLLATMSANFGRNDFKLHTGPMKIRANDKVHGFFEQGANIVQREFQLGQLGREVEFTVTQSEHNINALASGNYIPIPMKTTTIIPVDGEDNEAQQPLDEEKLLANGELETIVLDDQLNLESMEPERSTAQVRQRAYLRNYLLLAGGEPESFQDVSIAQLFAYCLNDEVKVVQLLSRAMSNTAVNVSLAFLKPNLDSSLVAYGTSPVGRLHIISAKIPCNIAGVAELPEFDLSVVKIRVTELNFELSDVASVDEKITLNAAADIFVVNAASERGLDLKLTLEMSDYMSELRFVAENLKSIVDLAKAISFDSTELEKLPEKQGPIDSQSFSPLASLRDKSSSVGFTLRLGAQKGVSFELSSIFLTSSGIQYPITAITILDPTSASCRLVKVEIEFQYSFGSAKMVIAEGEAEVEVERYLRFRFVSEPMATSSDFDFQLDLIYESGLSVNDVADAVGLNIDTSLSTSFPLLGAMIQKARAIRLSLCMALSDGKASFEDWSVALIIEKMTILPKFHLHDLKLNISKLVGGNLTCDGQAGFYTEAIDKYFRVSCRLPQKVIPGYIAVDAPGGLTLAEIAKCFSGLDATAVPTLKDMFDIELSKFRIEIGYKTLSEGGDLTSNSKLSVLGVNASLSKDELAIQIGDTKTLKFTDLELLLTWYTKDYFSAVGGKSLKTFSAKATLPGGSFTGNLAYKSTNSSLSLELIPMEWSLVGELLKTVLFQDLANAIIPVIGDFAMKDSSILIDTIDKCINRLDMGFEKAGATTSGHTQSLDNDGFYPDQDTLLISSTISFHSKLARLSFVYGGADGQANKTILFGVSEVKKGALGLRNIFTLCLPDNSGSMSSLWDLDLLSSRGLEENLKPSPLASFAPRESNLAAILNVFGLKDLSEIPLLNQLKDNGTKNIFSGPIIPADSAMPRIVDILDQVIPGTDSALHSSFVNLSMKKLEMTLDKKTPEPTSFQTDFSPDSELRLQAATSNRIFVLRSLQIHYVRTMDKKLDAKSEAVYTLRATVHITGVNMDFTLSSSTTKSDSTDQYVGFSIALGSAKNKDPGLQALLVDFSLTINEKEFINKNKSGLKLDMLSFQVKAAPSLKLVKEPAIALNRVRLNISYSTSNNKIKVISGELEIAQLITLSIGYIKSKDSQEFRAKAKAIRTALFKRSGGSIKLKLASIMQFLLGCTANSSIPDFVTEAEIVLNSSSIEISFTEKKDGRTSTSLISISVYINDLTQSHKSRYRFRQGVSFMLLHNGEPFLVSKAKKSKDNDGKSDSLEIKNLDKQVNGVSISNVGLGYDAKGQKVKIKFTARATIGPLDGELINFVMAVRLPRARQGRNILLSDWSDLAMEMDLDGLSLGVKHAGRDEFVSLMAYAMVQVTLLKTPYVEVRGISDGFGLGSQLIIPTIDDIHNFPLLMESSSRSDAITTFAKFQGASGGRYIKETNGSSWVAAGVPAVACETVDISAIVTFPLDPNVGQISILGTASVRFPRETEKDALASIKLNFSGTIDVEHESLVLRGQIADKSFLLLEDCILTGVFAFGAWFDPSPQAGDWCISIGGWHPAYILPQNYPPAPPRLCISWSYKEHLSLSGTAYAAITPDALMGGIAVHAAFRMWKLEASFNFRADLILNMHPLHYDATIQISANLSNEIEVGPFVDKWSICFQAGLHISGPPFGGVVCFNWAVIKFSVEFGDEYEPPKKLSLHDFVEICLKKDENSPNADHILALEGGSIPSDTASKEPQRPDSLWTSKKKILSRPMQLRHDSHGLESTLTVTIDGQKLKEPFKFELIEERVPPSLWGPYDSDTGKMLAGSSRESIVTHVTGLRIRAPESMWYTNNPKVVPFSADCSRALATFPNDSELIKNFGEKRRIHGASIDMGNAKNAILGKTRDREAMVSRNVARVAIVNNWASFRQLTKTSATEAASTLDSGPLLSIKSFVPQRYAEELEHFCHGAPGVAIG